MNLIRKLKKSELPFQYLGKSLAKWISMKPWDIIQESHLNEKSSDDVSNKLQEQI